MWGRRAPQLFPAEVAGVELVVAAGAQWSRLPLFPHLIWEPSLREAEVTKASRKQSAVHARPAEQFCSADADDLEVHRGRHGAGAFMNQAELKHRWRPSNSGFQQQRY